MTKRRIFNKIDKPLLVITILCLAFGVMMVGSASSLKAYMTKSNSYYYFIRQLFFIGVGFSLSNIITVIPIKKYKKLIYFILVCVFGALIYVLLNEKVMNGIKGWMFIMGFGIQPSEFAKTALILFFALSFDKMIKQKDVSFMSKSIPFIIAFIFITLIFKQPDLGTMLIILGIMFVFYLLAPYDKKTKLILMCIALSSVLIVAVTMLITGKGLNETQKSRFNFTKPCTRYRNETGYQVCNGYIAINSGGLLGTGYGNSKQKFLYLPEAHTDFIFAIIIEEMGLISGLLIMLAYFIMLWRIIMIGKRSYNLQGTVICYGIATYISLHIIINLGGVLGIIPLTGVPLPFYSYGGSFMINLLICIGLVQRVCVENKLFEQRNLVR